MLKFEISISNKTTTGTDKGRNKDIGKLRKI